MTTARIRHQYGVTSNNRPRLKTIWPNGKVRSRILPMPPLGALLEGASGAEEMERLVQVYARGRADGRRAARRERGRLLANLVREGVHHTRILTCIGHGITSYPRMLAAPSASTWPRSPSLRRSSTALRRALFIPQPKPGLPRSNQLSWI